MNCFILSLDFHGELTNSADGIRSLSGASQNHFVEQMHGAVEVIANTV